MTGSASKTLHEKRFNADEIHISVIRGYKQSSSFLTVISEWHIHILMSSSMKCLHILVYIWYVFSRFND